MSHPSFKRRKCCRCKKCFFCPAETDVYDADYNTLPDDPELKCPVVTGMTVTLSGIHLLDFGPDTGNVLRWENSTLSGSFCLSNGGACGKQFRSIEPVAKAVTDTSPDPDNIPVQTAQAFVVVEFHCGWRLGTGGAGVEPPGPDNPEGYISAFVAAVIDGKYGGNGVGDDVIVFTSSKTNVPWPRGCNLAGFTIENSQVNEGDQPIDATISAGYGGTITTGLACPGPQFAACTSTGVAIDFFNAPLAGISLDATLVSGCSYAFDDGRYHGTITQRFVYGTLYASPLASFITMRDRMSSDAVVFLGRLDSENVTPVEGTYNDAPNSNYIGYPEGDDAPYAVVS